tara:strand:+ start:234 stop:425 length:192 start_codon:yes stop_codon:yes gene_type:complete
MIEPKIQCAKKKCSWKGTPREQDRKPEKRWSRAFVLICPECGNDEFYDLMPSGKIMTSKEKFR